MKTVINTLGEIKTTWTSHKHPDTPNFIEVVRFMHIQYPDGRNNLHWRLFNSSANDKHIIANITLDEAHKKFVDAEVIELTESDFHKFLAERK